MAKKFVFKGKSLEELQAMDVKEFIELIPSRQRRSIQRGYTEAQKKVLAKIKAQLAGTYKKQIKTHCRDLIILPEMVGLELHVHNGKSFVKVHVQPEMVGNYIGSYVPTRNRLKHSSPGVGATKSSGGGTGHK